MPRALNWAARPRADLLVPLVVALALVVGLSGLVVGFTDAPATGGGPVTLSTARTPTAPGTGGGTELRPPGVVRAQLLSLSARVSGTPTIRRGPGVQYAAVARASDGEEYHVIACSPGCEWLRVFTLTDDGQWWLPSVFVSVSGDVARLPVLAPTENSAR